MGTGSFFGELKRRNVWRAAALYIGAIWALGQGIASLGPCAGRAGVGHALVRDRGRHRLSVLARVRMVLRMYAGGLQARAGNRAWIGFIVMSGDNDLAGAAQHFERALALDSADPVVLRGSAELLSNLGRLDEALALGAALVRRDPVNVTAHMNLGMFRSRGRVSP